MNRFVICKYPVLVLLLTGCGLFGDPDKRVIFPPEPDPLEYQYVELAGHISSEKPCYLISQNSVSVSPLNSPGTRAQFIRSHCFTTVAKRAARPELCQYVASVSTLLYPGHRNNRERCIEEAGQATASSGVGMVDYNAMFELAGFSDEEIRGLIQTHQLPDNGRYCLVFSPAFFEAIERMPRFSSEDGPDQMKNVEWNPHPFLSLPGFPCEGKFMGTK